MQKTESIQQALKTLKRPTMFDRVRQGEIVLGTTITVTDPTVTEALCSVYDFVWIDMEHNALSLEVVQGHIMATKGTNVTALVRVPWNDPVIIKPVLDIGAHGIIAPMVRTVEETKRLVASCLYPPDGIRGYSPRRPSNFGRLSGPDFCKALNESMLIVAQIEHIDAVNDIDNIVRVPGLSGIVLGPNDLSGSMGHMGEPRHPDVLAAIDTVLAAALKAGVCAGMSIGADATLLQGWIDKGFQWIHGGSETTLMLQSADRITSQLREHVRARNARPA